MKVEASIPFLVALSSKLTVIKNDCTDISTADKLGNFIKAVNQTVDNLLYPSTHKHLETKI